MAFGGPFFKIKLREKDVPGSSLGDKSVEEATIIQLQRWLECRGLKTSGPKPELIKRLHTKQVNYVISSVVLCANSRWYYFILGLRLKATY